MTSELELDPATLKYQLAVPRVVESISPALAALHVTRSRLSQSSHAGGSRTFDTTHCTACGTYLRGGTGCIRAMRIHAPRKSGKPYLRVLRKSCLVCGKHQDIPIEEGEPPALAKATKRQILTASVPNPVPSSELVPANKPPVAVPKPSPILVVSSSAASPAPSSPQLPRPQGQDTKAIDQRGRARAKKKTGLSDMLARNRERQEKERLTGENTGLAAFLQNL